VQLGGVLRGICTQRTDHHDPYTFHSRALRALSSSTQHTEHRINQANAFASTLHPAFTSWDKAKLLKWIQQKLSIPLEPDDEEKFLNARINGEVFLASAGSEDFYTRPSIGLSFGASFQLAELARNTISKKSKYSIMDVT